MSPTHLDLQVEVDPTQLTQKLGTLSKDKLPKHYKWQLHLMRMCMG